MEVIKEELESVQSLLNTELTESHAYTPADTGHTVITPLFIISPADVEEAGQPASSVS